MSTSQSNLHQWSKTEVIELILKMKELDREYAKHVYARENALHPEWALKDAFIALKGK